MRLDGPCRRLKNGLRCSILCFFPSPCECGFRSEEDLTNASTRVCYFTAAISRIAGPPNGAQHRGDDMHLEACHLVHICFRNMFPSLACRNGDPEGSVCFRVTKIPLLCPASFPESTASMHLGDWPAGDAYAACKQPALQIIGVSSRKMICCIDD